MTLYDHLRHQERAGHPAARETARALLRCVQEPEPERERDARDAEVLGRELRSRWGLRVRR